MKYTITRRLFLCATGAVLMLPWFESSAQTQGIPQTLPQLWEGFVDHDKTTPLEAEVLKEWEQDGVVCRIVRYQVGVFKGAPSRVAAFYAFPKGATKLPAILEMHGGGQSASLNSVVTYAKRGYASLSLNWGGNKMSIGKRPGAVRRPTGANSTLHIRRSAIRRIILQARSRRMNSRLMRSNRRETAIGILC